MKTFAFLFLPILFFTACIGTDYIDDPTIPERLVISPRIDSIPVGQTVQFSAAYFNDRGAEEQAAVVWESTDESVVMIDQTGKATGLSVGPARIIAIANNVADSLILNTAGVTNSVTFRTGAFQNVGNSYNASGGVRLERLEDGSLRLDFENDFSTSPGPSLYVLLANHTNGAYTVTPGNQAVNSNSAQITPARLMTFNGQQTYEVPAGIGINDYKYVVLYCTLGPVFGFAELK